MVILFRQNILRRTGNVLSPIRLLERARFLFDQLLITWLGGY